MFGEMRIAGPCFRPYVDRQKNWVEAVSMDGGYPYLERGKHVCAAEIGQRILVVGSDIANGRLLRAFGDALDINVTLMSGDSVEIDPISFHEFDFVVFTIPNGPSNRLPLLAKVLRSGVLNSNPGIYICVDPYDSSDISDIRERDAVTTGPMPSSVKEFAKIIERCGRVVPKLAIASAGQGELCPRCRSVATGQ